jgi:hypothetical protein
VEYADGGTEYYDRANDPDQLRNIAAPAATATKDACTASWPR